MNILQQVQQAQDELERERNALSTREAQLAQSEREAKEESRSLRAKESQLHERELAVEKVEKQISLRDDLKRLTESHDLARKEMLAEQRKLRKARNDQAEEYETLKAKEQELKEREQRVSEREKTYKEKIRQELHEELKKRLGLQ